MHEVDFIESNLTSSVFDNCDLTGAIFENTNLEKSDFSTAYNFSVRGPILPLGTDALALTPISPFRPRRWNGAILPNSARVRFEVLDYYKRAVSATADAYEVRDIVSVDAFEDKNIELKLLFDPDHSLEERILNEQFL